MAMSAAFGMDGNDDRQSKAASGRSTHGYNAHNEEAESRSVAAQAPRGGRDSKREVRDLDSEGSDEEEMVDLEQA